MIIIQDDEQYLDLMNEVMKAQAAVDSYLDHEDYEMAAEWSNERNDRMILLYEFLEERLPSL